MFKINTICSLSLLLLFNSISLGQKSSDVEQKIKNEIKWTNINIGISAIHVESGRTFSFNESKRFPMASVYKFPIAIVLLNQVEKGQLSLNQKVTITKSDIRGGFKGPVAIKYPNGGVDLPVSTLLQYMIVNSDNSASDLLLRLIGGPKAATTTLRKLGFQDISIDRYEKDLLLLDSNSESSLFDTSSAKTLALMIRRFFSGDLLNKDNTSLLKKLMTNPNTPNHIASGLPDKTPQFHKSGWCTKNLCINDLAMVTLPNDKGHLAIAVLVSGLISDTKKTSTMIGKISRIIFDDELAQVE